MAAKKTKRKPIPKVLIAFKDENPLELCISVQKGAIARLAKIFGKAHLVYFALLLKLPNGRVCDKRSDNIVPCGTRDLEKNGVSHTAFTNGVRTLEDIGLIKQVEPREFHGRRPHRFEVLRVPEGW